MADRVVESVSRVRNVTWDFEPARHERLLDPRIGIDHRLRSRDICVGDSRLQRAKVLDGFNAGLFYIDDDLSRLHLVEIDRREPGSAGKLAAARFVGFHESLGRLLKLDPDIVRIRGELAAARKDVANDGQLSGGQRIERMRWRRALCGSASGKGEESQLSYEDQSGRGFRKGGPPRRTHVHDLTFLYEILLVAASGHGSFQFRPSSRRLSSVGGARRPNSAKTFRTNAPGVSSLLNLLEIPQIRRRLVLLDWHQVSVGADAIERLADADQLA